MPKAASVALVVSLALPSAAEEPALAVAAELPVAARVLDLAAAGGGRVVVLMDGALALLRVDARGALALVDERPLAVSSAVRAPAGILLADPAGDTCWVATNRAEGAILFSLEGDQLWEVQRAAALPWPGAPRGMAFRAGTNLVEVEMAGLGAGPFVRVGRTWAISNDGRLGIAGAGWTAVRVGSAAAAVDDATLAVSGPEPPGAADRIALLRVPGGETTSAIEVVGAVTALAAAPAAGAGRMIAGVVHDGAARVLLLERRVAR